MLSQRFLISVLALALAAGCASASTMTYTDPTAFNTATQSLFFTQIDFNTAAFLLSNGYTDASGAVFADDSGNNANLSESSTCANTCAPNGELKDNGQFGFAITLPSNIYAFSFYVSASANVDVAFDGNGVFSSTNITAPSTPTFFGAVTTAPITNFTITATNGHPIIDDFEISSGAAPTAEATPFILIGSGLILLRLLGRRMRRKAEAQAAGRSRGLAASELRLA